MSYNPNIPLGTDPILQSAKQIRSNFNVINDTFGVDHIPLTADSTIAGKHAQLTLLDQSDPNTLAGQIAIYNKLVSSIPELFFRPENNGTPIQLTYPSISTGLQSTNPDVYLQRQYSFMAGPFVIYGGLIPKAQVIAGATITLLPATNLLGVFFNITNTVFPGPILFNINAVNIVANTFQLDFGTLVGNNGFDIYYTAIGI